MIPITLALVVVAIIALFAYERAARDVVLQRDAELANVSAARLAEGLSRLNLLLQSIAEDDGVRSLEAARMKRALEREQDHLLVFNAGVVIYNDQGMAVGSDPFAFQRRGMRFPVPSEFDKVLTTLMPSFSNVFTDEISGGDVVLLTVPIVARGPEFRGVVAGMSTLNSLLLIPAYSEVLEITAGSERFAYLVDGNGRVIFHSDRSRLGTDLSAIVPVKRVSEGNTSAVIAEGPEGKTVISGFAPVPDTDWAVITQEKWESVVGPIRDFSRVLLGLLVVGGVLSAVLVFFAIGRVLKPVKDLTEGAKRIAEGDFEHTISGASGDEVQALAQQFNIMAGALKESYAGLEQKVEARTEELQESEQRYRTLFEESKDAIYIRSLDGKIIDVNQADLDLFGYTREEALGSDVGDRYVDPAERQRFEEEMAKSGSVRDFEGKHLKVDGTVMDCLITANLVRSSDGTVLGYQGIVRDITERKRAEETIREAEEKYRTLFEESIDAIYIRSLDGEIIDLNQAALDLFGFTKEEAMRSDVADRYADPAERQRFEEEMAKSGSVRDFEGKRLKADGTEMDCLITANLLRSNDGTVVGLQGIIRDITDRKRAEETIRDAEEKYRSIFDHSKDPIFIMSREGLVLDVNQSGLDMSGFEKQELIGLVVKDMCVSPEEHRELVTEVIREGSVKDYEIQMLKKDGSEIDCLVSITLQLDEDGNIIGYQGMVRDITEHKRADEAAIQQTREVAVLEERNRMAREIHDTMAQGFTGIVLQLEAGEQAITESPGALVDHLSRAKGLAREGLQEARRSVWDLLPRALEQLPLPAALEEEVQRFGADGSEEAAFTLSGEKRDLAADVQTVLFRICQESLTNIRRHAGATEVGVNLIYRPGEVHLSVKDNGAGFDPTNTQQQDGRNSFGLTGMEQRAQQLRGSLEIQSHKGRGTLVEVTIPTS